MVVAPGGLPPRQSANAIVTGMPAVLIGLRFLLAFIDYEVGDSPSKPVGPLLTR